MTETTAEETTALVLRDEIPTTQEIRERLREIDKYRNDIHDQLIPSVDFGKIPGTQRPTLLKPGAEKAYKLLKLRPVYVLTDKVMDLDRGFIQFEYKCILISKVTGEPVDEGVGECNSWESKYRWREQKRRCPACDAEAIFRSKEEYGGGWYCNRKAGGCGKNFPRGTEVIEVQQVGRVENEDPADQFNTIKKMAKKRSLVDAALSACNLSAVFTQDLDDMAEYDRQVSVTAERTAPPNRTDYPPKEAPPPATARVEPSTPAPSNGNAGGGAPATVNPLEFANVGMLMTAAKDHLHLTYQDVRTILEIEQPSEITDYVWAWEALEKAASERQAAFA